MKTVTAVLLAIAVIFVFSAFDQSEARGRSRRVQKRISYKSHKVRRVIKRVPRYSPRSFTKRRSVRRSVRNIRSFTRSNSRSLRRTVRTRGSVPRVRNNLLKSFSQTTRQVKTRQVKRRKLTRVNRHGSNFNRQVRKLRSRKYRHVQKWEGRKFRVMPHRHKLQHFAQSTQRYRGVRRRQHISSFLPSSTVIANGITYNYAPRRDALDVISEIAGIVSLFTPRYYTPYYVPQVVERFVEVPVAVQGSPQQESQPEQFKERSSLTGNFSVQYKDEKKRYRAEIYPDEIRIEEKNLSITITPDTYQKIKDGRGKQYELRTKEGLELLLFCQ